MPERIIPIRDGSLLVGDHGTILHVASDHLLKLDQFATGGGYLHVRVHLDGARQMLSVHRLIAEAFLGPCPLGYEANHKDGCRTNNTASNIEYLTPSENRRHFLRLQRTVKATEIYSRSKFPERDARVLKLREQGLTYKEIGDLVGTSQTQIMRVVRRAYTSV